jgi:prevent-host-death family protein
LPVEEIARTHEQYTVTRNGKPVVVMMAADDFEALMETLALLREPGAALSASGHDAMTWVGTSTRSA